MTIEVQSKIKAIALNDINYLITLVQQCSNISSLIDEITTCNFPHLAVGHGSSHVWAKQVINGNVEDERTLFIH